jgi:anti-sigma regulatory factor (Ser/Thr protein kinase)
MLGGVAEPLAIDPELLDDLKTAVSEACNNVVLHAYGGQPGPMVVKLFVDPARIYVTVADAGIGLPTGRDSFEHAEGIGLSVIRALADEVSLTHSDGGGTEVRMDFAALRGDDLLFEAPTEAGPDDPWPYGAAGQVVVSLSPVALLPGVLGRLARTLAATAHFSLDRFSDVYLVTDTLAAHAASAAAKPRIGAQLTAQERRLEITVGPFAPGTAAVLRADPPARGDSPLILLSDSVTIAHDGDHELLHVVVADRRGP